tara:strand:- start:6045 stop:7274 length:1230 start_codon:yes stop_codon:yes gene_type:complete
MDIKKLNILLSRKKIQYEDFINDMSTMQKPFSEDLLVFIDKLSKVLLKGSAYRKYPEFIALGYWLRKSNIKKITSEVNKNENSIKMPIGIVFHIAPSNVDTIFVYSLVISLLMGNKNIVRVSSKESRSRDLLISLIQEVFLTIPENKTLHNLIIISYEHNEKVSSSISIISDARMIWGGDSTISHFTNLPTKPTCVDIKFANKYSFSIFDIASFKSLQDDQISKLARDFVNDSYLFGQQGCSSPRAICWYGKSSLDFENAKSKFWKTVCKLANEFDHGLCDADFVEKLNYIHGTFIERDSVSLNNDSKEIITTVLDVNINNLIDASKHCGRGVFLQSTISDLDHLNPYIDKSIQTISYFGFNKEQLIDWASLNFRGIDRIVKVGTSLEFDYVWDGFNLLESLSRIVTLK